MYEREEIPDDEFVDYESEEFENWADYVGYYGDPDAEYDRFIDAELDH